MGERGRLLRALAMAGAQILLAWTATACAGGVANEGRAEAGGAETDGARTADGSSDEVTEATDETSNTSDGAEDDGTIEGTEGDDTLEGTENAGAIEGRGGDDLIAGMAGADRLWGGPGADTLYAGPYDADVDALEGGEGDDTLVAADLPASRDVARCGPGSDEVTVDSLDEAADCEDVDRIQETEPEIAEGTYELVPSPSSECSMGEGTLVVGVDPATGQRGVEQRFNPVKSEPGDPPLECGDVIDYETPVTKRGEPAPRETMRRAYEGEKHPPRDINEIMKGRGRRRWEGNARNLSSPRSQPPKPRHTTTTATLAPRARRPPSGRASRVRFPPDSLFLRFPEPVGVKMWGQALQKRAHFA